MSALYDKLAILDVETTGTSPTHDRVINLGLVLIDQDSVTQTWESLINPQRRLPPEITTLTGISGNDLAHAPTFSEILDEVQTLLTGRTLVAHFSRFDYAFLKQEFERAGRNFNVPQLCSVKLSRFLFPQEKRHGLDSVMARFNLQCQQRHRALGDAQVIWDFLQVIRGHFSNEHLQAVIPSLIRSAVAPSLIPELEIAALPSCPGVYIFRDEAEYPLYVGKSINIRQRVKSHWYDDVQSAKELQLSSRAAHVDYQTSAGEIGALILESKLIKELKPLYNRRSREKKNRCGVWLEKNAAGYLQPHLEIHSKITVAQMGNLLTVFPTRHKAQAFFTQLATDHHLCGKMLGLEKGKGGCFGYHLGMCAGACVGKELPAKFNLRLETALSTFKIQQWPFPSAICFGEHNEETDQNEVHLFNNWCWLGTFTELPDEEHIRQLDAEFDEDLYHILRHLLRNKMHQIIPIDI